jgi:thermitase
VFLGTLLSFAFSEEGFKPVRGKDLFVPGEYIVSYTGFQFESKAAATQKAAEVCQNANMTVVKVAKFAPILTCKLKEGEDFATVKAALLKNKRIRAVEPNYIAWIPEPELKAQAKTQSASSNNAKIMTLTNDPYLYDQWGYFKILADATPDLPTSAPVIAIIDTGVDYNHPDLKGRVINGSDFVNGDTDPMDDYGHGTHCAGIAAAISNNGIVKVMTSAGSGTYDDIIDGIYAAANRSDVKVINMSLGGGSDIDALHDAVIYAVTTKHKLLVASAGNSDTSDPSYPAAYDEAFNVAASNIDDAKADYSNWGNDLVDIAAPGGDFLVDWGIVSTVPFWYNPTGYDYFQGTSMASPCVAGAAARVWAANPTWTNTQVRDALVDSGDTLPFGGGEWPELPTFKRLNLYNALGLADIDDRAVMSGYFLDAVTGLGLSGAKVQALQGTVVKATDYVDLWGYAAMVFDPGSNYRFKITKTKYPTITIPPTSDDPMTFLGETLHQDGGVIPLAPAQGAWQLTVAWDDGWYDFDPYLMLPDLGLVGLGYDGRMNSYPYARWFRDCWVDGIPVEAISVKKTISGTYYFFVVNWNNEDLTDPDIGLKAFIYKGSILKAVLYAESANVIGEPDDDFWYIGRIVGSTFYEENSISDAQPGITSTPGKRGTGLKPPLWSKPPFEKNKDKNNTLPR